MGKKAPSDETCTPTLFIPNFHPSRHCPFRNYAFIIDQGTSMQNTQRENELRATFSESCNSKMRESSTSSSQDSKSGDCRQIINLNEILPPPLPASDHLHSGRIPSVGTTSSKPHPQIRQTSVCSPHTGCSQKPRQKFCVSGTLQVSPRGLKRIPTVYRAQKIKQQSDRAPFVRFSARGKVSINVTG